MSVFEPATTRRRAWWPETLGSLRTTSLSGSRPIRMTVTSGEPGTTGHGMRIVCPSVIVSDAETRVDRAIFTPLTYVPFDDPRSSTK